MRQFVIRSFGDFESLGVAGQWDGQDEEDNEEEDEDSEDAVGKWLERHLLWNAIGRVDHEPYGPADTCTQQLKNKSGKSFFLSSTRFIVYILSILI